MEGGEKMIDVIYRLVVCIIILFMSPFILLFIGLFIGGIINAICYPFAMFLSWYYNIE